MEDADLAGEGDLGSEPRQVTLLVDREAELAPEGLERLAVELAAERHERVVELPEAAVLRGRDGQEGGLERQLVGPHEGVRVDLAQLAGVLGHEPADLGGDRGRGRLAEAREVDQGDGGRGVAAGRRAVDVEGGAPPRRLVEHHFETGPSDERGHEVGATFEAPALGEEGAHPASSLLGRSAFGRVLGEVGLDLGVARLGHRVLARQELVDRKPAPLGLVGQQALFRQGPGLVDQQAVELRFELEDLHRHPRLDLVAIDRLTFEMGDDLTRRLRRPRRRPEDEGATAPLS